MKPRAKLLKGWNAYQIHNDRLLARAVINELGEGAPRPVIEGESQVGAILGTSIVWPGDVYAYLESTQRDAELLDADITSHEEQLPPDFIQAWRLWLSQWTAFFKREMAETHYLDERQTMGETDVFVDRLKNFQLRAQSKGFAKEVPGVHIDPMSTMLEEGFLPHFSMAEKLLVAVAATTAVVIMVKKSEQKTELV